MTTLDWHDDPNLNPPTAISDDAEMDNPDGNDGNDDEDVNPDLIIIPMGNPWNVGTARADKRLYRVGAHAW